MFTVWPADSLWRVACCEHTQCDRMGNGLVHPSLIDYTGTCVHQVAASLAAVEGSTWQQHDVEVQINSMLLKQVCLGARCCSGWLSIEQFLIC